MKTTIRDIQSPYDHIRILTLAKPDGFNFAAGQYIMIKFGDLDPRPYSIASGPHENTISIHIKDNGGAVTNYVMTTLSKGETIDIDGPFGTMVLDQDIAKHDHPLVLIAGGLGITPMKSILEEAVSQGHNGKIFLYWGTQKEEDFYLGDYFESLMAKDPNIVFKPVTGHLVGVFAAEDLPSLSDAQFYIAGSPEMIQSTAQIFQDKGVPAGNIFYDQY